MNVRPTLLLLLSAITLPVAAQSVDDPQLKTVVVTAPRSDHVTPQQLARETGLSERSVRMLVGARTPFAEYRTSFDRTQQRFAQALGPGRYQDFIEGRPISLYRQGLARSANDSRNSRELAAATDGNDVAITP